MGYSLKVLKSGQRIEYRGDERFPTASTIKTGVMVAAIQEVDEGKLRWTEQRPMPPPEQREASMWSFFLKEGTKLDLDGWVNLMITVSDNTALINVRNWIGTMEINRRLEALGLPNTKILGNAPPEATSVRRLRTMFGMGMTTPNEMNRLLELIYQRKAASPAGCDKMIRILSHDYWDDYIGITIPPEVKYANKVGAISCLGTIPTSSRFTRTIRRISAGWRATKARQRSFAPRVKCGTSSTLGTHTEFLQDIEKSSCLRVAEWKASRIASHF